MSERAHRWIVDSIEELVACIEVDGDQMITVSLSLLPDGTRQGDILRVAVERGAKTGRSMLTIEIDHVATKQALADSAAQVERGRKASRDPGGDITL